MPARLPARAAALAHRLISTPQNVPCCRHLGCADAHCQLCAQNQLRRCPQAFCPKYLAGDPLKAACGAAIRCAPAPLAGARSLGAGFGNLKFEVAGEKEDPIPACATLVLDYNAPCRVELVDRATGRVAAAHPPMQLQVGHLSLPQTPACTHPRECATHFTSIAATCASLPKQICVVDGKAYEGLAEGGAAPTDAELDRITLLANQQVDCAASQAAAATMQAGRPAAPLGHRQRTRDCSGAGCHAVAVQSAGQPA